MAPSHNQLPPPPKWAVTLLNWLHPSETLEEVEGDLVELYAYWYQQHGKRKADMRYAFAVLSALPPFVRRRSGKISYTKNRFLHAAMIRNYLSVAWRNLSTNKAFSFINIGGLAMGMATAILIGLWMWDELSFNKYHRNYDRIAQLWQFVNFDGKKVSYNSLPIPLAAELANNYPEFKSVSVTTYPREVILANENNKFSKTGMYVQPAFADIMSLRMLAGTSAGLFDMHSILLSESLANTMFGHKNPLHQLIKMGNKQIVKVSGVYEDFPHNSSFKEVFFLAPWDLFVSQDSYAKRSLDQWDENSFQIFAQLQPGVDANKVSAKIKDIRMKKEDPPPYKPEFFLHPMAKWHLYADFQNGENTGGLIYYVYLFGIIGVFVLLLACINFMNLSTARSEKRAKEVGIRKTLGSLRGQLIFQFLSESLLISFLAFALSLLLVLAALPYFNQLADKKITLLWVNPFFWMMCLIFCFITGLIAGSYPALYLSSFQPLHVLKGTFKVVQFAALPRKVLVVFQFSVSIALIIGIITVFRQIELAKDRPAGYSRQGLIEIKMNTPEVYGQLASLKNDLLHTGAVAGISQSMGSITDDYGGTTAVFWPGKSPDMHPLLMVNRITHDYGKTVGWQLLAGRDFSGDFATDSSAMIVNESALKLMGLENPIGINVRLNNKDYRIIGIIGDMIKDNPFKPVKPSLFILDYASVNVINIRLSQAMGIQAALRKVESIFTKYNPAAPFEYTFVDEQYGQKFSHEKRIGKLATFFTVLAIFISCLGLFGLASFVAQQRKKEIGIRKVLGASVFQLWGLLSKDFVYLVLIAFIIAAPTASYFLRIWLENYEYRTSISWWVFAISGASAVFISLLTISYQSIKAALMKPAKTLRTE